MWLKKLKPGKKTFARFSNSFSPHAFHSPCPRKRNYGSSQWRFINPQTKLVRCTILEKYKSSKKAGAEIRKSRVFSTKIGIKYSRISLQFSKKEIVLATVSFFAWIGKKTRKCQFYVALPYFLDYNEYEKICTFVGKLSGDAEV